MDKQLTKLEEVNAALRAEAEPMLLSSKQIETIETLAAELRNDVIDIDNDREAQRGIFQLLDLRFILNHEDKQRWADVSCNLGNACCPVDHNII